METLEDINELFATKKCSPVMIFGIIFILSCVCIYLIREKLKNYNTHKMDTLSNVFTLQEGKYLLILGIVLFGLCQYNKTDLAWIFLIFPIIYSLLQNVLLFIHVSSAVQNAPKELPMVSQHYGYGMQAPLLNSQGYGPSPPQQTKPVQIQVPPPEKKQEDFMLPKLNSQQRSMGGGFGSVSAEPQGFNL